MINKDGLEVPLSPRAVRDELLRGTGAVMADGASIYVEDTNVHDRQIVVARSPVEDAPLQRAHYDVEKFEQAWEKFLGWKQD